MSSLRAASFLLVLLAASCDDAGPVRDDRPNVVLITLDTTRVDRVMGTERSARLAPNLTAFAAECRAFTSARSVGSLTLPAHASMLTGLYPPRHGARANGPQVLPPAADTLAEQASRAGYATAGFVASLALDRAYGIAQGFEFWDQPALGTDRVAGEISERTGLEVAESVTRWLAARPATDDRPLLLWAHFFDPHAPYAPPAAFLERAGGDPYDGEIAALDAAFGALLAGLRAHAVLDDAVVLIVGDHGESLGEHGEATHGLFAYDATLHVPFWLREADGERAGTLEPALVSVVDVQPTLLQAMGIEPETGIDGVGLYGRAAPAGRRLYCESLEGWRLYGWSPLTGIVDARGKYLHSSAPEFYALGADPQEADDLFAADGSLDVSSYLHELRRLAQLPALSLGSSAELDEGRRRELEALGYTTSAHEADAFPAPGSADDGPSPADSIAEAQAVEDALAYFVRGRLDEAAQRFEEILAANPLNRTAAERLIEIRLAREEWEAALQLLRRRAELPPETIALHRDLARCLTALGREEEAEPHVRRSLELFIAHHERRGELEKAAQYRRILASAPR